MFFEVCQLVLIGGLCVAVVVKDTLLEHNRALLRGMKDLLRNEECYNKPKIQEYVKKCLDLAV